MEFKREILHAIWNCSIVYTYNGDKVSNRLAILLYRIKASIIAIICGKYKDVYYHDVTKKEGIVIATWNHSTSYWGERDWTEFCIGRGIFNWKWSIYTNGT